MRKMQSVNGKGFAVVEMTMILPLIFLAVFMIIWIFIFVLEKEKLRTDAYVELYQVPWVIVEEEREGDYLNSINLNKGHPFGKVKKQVSFDGTNRVILSNIELKLSSYTLEKCETDLVADRLRGWQFYGNFTEK